MDLVPVRLAAGVGARNRLLDPETLVDVLWATALPDDRLEHVRARPGPLPGTLDAVLFHLPPNCTAAGGYRSHSGPTDGSVTAGSAAESATDAAFRLCRRALLSAPCLSGWSVAPLDSDTETPPWETL